MRTFTDSLWSPEIQSDVVSPRDILETQAIVLRELTQGALSGTVRESHDNGQSTIDLSFEIIVAGFDSLRHRIVDVRHTAGRIYPCHVESEASRFAEVAHSPLEVQELLRQVLHSGEVKALVLSLLALVKEQRSTLSPPLTRHHNGHKRNNRRVWFGYEAQSDDVNGTMDSLYDEPQGID